MFMGWGSHKMHISMWFEEVCLTEMERGKKGFVWIDQPLSQIWFNYVVEFDDQVEEMLSY